LQTETQLKEIRASFESLGVVSELYLAIIEGEGSRSRMAGMPTNQNGHWHNYSLRVSRA